MKANFDSAIEIAITTVAKMLGISAEEVARKAQQPGPVRDSVMMLAATGKEAA
jgi:hypothetical protein